MEQVDQELIFGLPEHLDNLLIARVIHIDVELSQEHHILFFLRVLPSVLVKHGLLEKVLGADGRHFRTTTLPLSFDEDLTLDVCLLAQLFLLEFLFLISFELLLLLLAERAIGLVALFEVLFAHFTPLKFNSAEGKLLD